MIPEERYLRLSCSPHMHTQVSVHLHIHAERVQVQVCQVVMICALYEKEVGGMEELLFSVHQWQCLHLCSLSSFPSD